MNTVDCVSEIMEECLNEGIEKGIEKGREEASIELGIKLLNKGFPIEELAKMIEIPIDKLESEYEKYKIESK